MGSWDFLIYATPSGMALIGGAYMAVASYLAHAMSKVPPVSLEVTPAHLGLPYEDVTFPAREDSLRLCGWLVPGRDDYPYVVVLHGAGGHRADPGINILGLTKALWDNGYNVLLFDLRGHGESAGARLSAGYFERRDALGAVDFLASRGVTPERIAFIGFSMGAVTALTAARLAGVRSVVADSAFCNLREIIRHRSRASRSLAMLLPGMLVVSRLLYGLRVGEIQPLKEVQQMDFPLLFIHGESDLTIPMFHSVRLYQEARHSHSRLWVVSGGQHARAFAEHPHEYVRRVVQYLSQTVGPVADEVEGVFAPV